MATTDEQDPVLIPSLPDPWEGLVGKAGDRAFLLGISVGRMDDFPEIVSATHASSRAEKALRVALLELLWGGKTGP